MLGTAHFENVGLDWTTFWVVSGLTIFFLRLTTVMSKLANNNAVDLPAVYLWAYFKITSYIWALVFALCIVLAFLFGVFPAHKGLVLDNNSGAEVIKTAKSGQTFCVVGRPGEILPTAGTLEFFCEIKKVEDNKYEVWAQEEKVK